MPRVGRKRSDRRWKAEDGKVWASKFEHDVYEYLRASGVNVRPCTASDSVTYSEPRPNVKCMACGSCECMQERIYTPDLFVIPDRGGAGSPGYYIEAKGYFRPEKRKLFRCLRNSRPDIDLRVVLEADHWVTRGKTRLSDYFERYLKTTPYCVGLNDIPEEWL